jgi:hypothetical protein
MLFIWMHWYWWRCSSCIVVIYHKKRVVLLYFIILVRITNRVRSCIVIKLLIRIQYLFKIIFYMISNLFIINILWLFHFTITSPMSMEAFFWIHLQFPLWYFWISVFSSSLWISFNVFKCFNYFSHLFLSFDLPHRNPHFFLRNLILSPSFL